METTADLERAIADARASLGQLRAGPAPEDLHGEGVADQGRVRATVGPGGKLASIVIAQDSRDPARLGAQLTEAINAAQDDLATRAGISPALTSDLAHAHQRVHEQAEALIEELEATLARLPGMQADPEVTPARWDGQVALATFGAEVDQAWHRAGALLDTVDSHFGEDEVGELLRGAFLAVRQLIDESLPSITDDFAALATELSEAAGIPEAATATAAVRPADAQPADAQPATAPPLRLPERLAPAAAAIGRAWPAYDEPGVMRVAAGLVALSGELRGICDRCEAHARAVLAAHPGPAVDEFAEEWRDPDRAPSVLRDAALGMLVVGPGTMLAAGLALVMKTAIIAQLALLQLQTAGAVAAAGATGGASLAWVPTARRLAGLGIDTMADTIMEALADDEDDDEHADYEHEDYGEEERE